MIVTLWTRISLVADEPCDQGVPRLVDGGGPLSFSEMIIERRSAP